MDLQQSPLYKKYIQALHWDVVNLDGVNMWMKKIPFLGTMAKIQRPDTLPYLPKLIPLLRKHHVQRVAVEPTLNTDPKLYQNYVTGLSKFFTVHKEPFLPTKTICVDLTVPEEKIFKKFTEAKRRAVRKAIKNGVIVKESNSITDLIHTKNLSAGMFGGITTYGIDKLWNIFYPKNTTILLAYHNEQMVGGILLLFYEHIAYYWIAGATKKGKKLFTPTLLVWEALRLSKKRNMKQFDFVGVWDQRIPKQNTSWKGFTKFKEGFGGKEAYYPTFLL
ncbi:MAG: peptidoglycan bridge formation glycyltransferase FemA/FemB family protein [Candidatus Gottesmanbacteria bacterium]